MMSDKTNLDLSILKIALFLRRWMGMLMIPNMTCSPNWPPHVISFPETTY